MRHHKAFDHVVDGYRNYFGQTFFGEIAFNTVIDDSSGFLKKGTSVIDWKQFWNFKASNANIYQDKEVKKIFFSVISVQKNQSKYCFPNWSAFKSGLIFMH